jgi:predicted nucleic acid-binding protein
VLIAGAVTAPTKRDVFRVCLDVNIFVTDLLGAALGRNSSSTQLIELVRRGHCSLGPLQLVISWTMLETLRLVLTRKFGHDDHWVGLLVRNIADLADNGAANQAPHILLGGTGALPMRDAEDGTVLDAALAGQADLLVTGDIDDFLNGSKSDLPMEILGYRDGKGGKKPAAACIPRYNEPDLIIGIPQEAIAWLTRGIEPARESLIGLYSQEMVSPQDSVNSASDPRIGNKI